MAGASAGDGYGQLATMGDREGGRVANLLQPVPPRLWTTIIVRDDVNIRRMNRGPMMPMEQAADCIFRSDSRP